MDDDVLRRARVRARVRAYERGTTVNALVRTHLETFAGSGEVPPALLRIAEIARLHRASWMAAPGAETTCSRLFLDTNIFV